MQTVTLNQIRAQGPCKGGYLTALIAMGHISARYASRIKDDIPYSLKELDDPTPRNIEDLAKKVGLLNTAWAIRLATKNNALYRRYAVWCLETVLTDDKYKACIAKLYKDKAVDIPDTLFIESPLPITSAIQTCSSLCVYKDEPRTHLSSSIVSVLNSLSKSTNYNEDILLKQLIAIIIANEWVN
ncbi:hypothetical protein [Dickeya phage Amaethon]|nr:hypothetical protein [Dickeya phage Amaethon]